MQDFYRIKLLPPYLFAEIDAQKLAARARGEDIIDFGMGNPDLPAPRHVIDKLTETVQNPRVHRYSASRGIPGLRRAFARYYQRRFGVSVDADSEVVVTLGSKEGLANLAQAITGPGDVVLSPDPCYPIHAYGFIIAGAEILKVPVGPNYDFLAGLEAAVAAQKKSGGKAPGALILNFPSNPTAQVVDLEFYKRVVHFARQHDIYILSDLAYAEIYFGEPPPSILQVPGAKDIAVEFSSMSKTYSMAGWRVGFAAGNPKLVAALARVKSYLDYGAFTPIQVAAAAALDGPQECVDAHRAVYRKRRDVLVEALARAGWEIPAPEATMFAWAPLPEGFAEGGSMAFAKQLLAEAGVAVSPGIGFGEHGEGFVRMALVENEQRIRQAARGIRKFLEKG